MPLPRGVKVSAVSNTTRPVTQVAEVAVKKASVQDKRSGYVAQGSLRSRVPVRMMKRNPVTGMREGV
jgi:hypothetical protein